jgi:hypothetical protein
MLLKSCREIEGGREADRPGGWLRAGSPRRALLRLHGEVRHHGFMRFQLEVKP